MRADDPDFDGPKPGEPGWRGVYEMMASGTAPLEAKDFIGFLQPLNKPEDRSGIHGKVADELLRRSPETVEGFSRRRTDTQPAQMRQGLATVLRFIADDCEDITDAQSAQLKLAADTLYRDEEENAAMIALLVNAGYKDVPPRVNAALIRRLLGLISPGA